MAIKILIHIIQRTTCRYYSKRILFNSKAVECRLVALGLNTRGTEVYKAVPETMGLACLVVGFVMSIGAILAMVWDDILLGVVGTTAIIVGVSYFLIGRPQVPILNPRIPAPLDLPFCCS